MKKIGKLLAAMGTAGAALAGLWYFLEQSKKAQNADKEIEDDVEETKEEEKRSYVTLDPVSVTEETEEKAVEECTAADDAAKEALKKNVAEAVSEAKAKAEEIADGVGVVKEDKQVSEFKFDTLDDKEEDKEEDKEADEE